MDEPEVLELPIEDVFDLHSFQPRDVPDVAREYLEQARGCGYRQVRIIHGRGKGVQRAAIRSLLATLDFVAAFHDADPGGGGWGATVVLFRE